MKETLWRHILIHMKVKLLEHAYSVLQYQQQNALSYNEAIINNNLTTTILTPLNHTKFGMLHCSQKHWTFLYHLLFCYPIKDMCNTNDQLVARTPTLSTVPYLLWALSLITREAGNVVVVRQRSTCTCPMLIPKANMT